MALGESFGSPHFSLEEHTVKVIKAYPPILKELRKTFPAIIGRPGILYAYGDILYNPSGVKITPWLLAHEEVHSGRQELAGLDWWWTKYQKDKRFRLEEELLAHRAEWKTYKAAHPDRVASLYLQYMGERLSSPLYGSMIGLYLAKSRIDEDDS